MKILLIIFALGLLSVGVYLNRSYARIYRSIDAAGLVASAKGDEYVFGTPTTTSSTLYVAIGDSLTSGVGTSYYESSYAYQVAEQLSRESGSVILKNHSYPGARTKGIADQVLPLVVEEKPDVVTVLIGVNDVHGSISVQEFTENYSHILKELTAIVDAKIYAIAIPFIGDKTLLRFPYNYYFDWRTQKFNTIIRELVEKFGATYIDLYSPTQELFKKNGTHYASDSFHPSEEGYRIWSNVIYAGFNH